MFLSKKQHICTYEQHIFPVTASPFGDALPPLASKMEVLEPPLHRCVLNYRCIDLFSHLITHAHDTHALMLYHSKTPDWLTALTSIYANDDGPRDAASREIANTTLHA